CYNPPAQRSHRPRRPVFKGGAVDLLRPPWSWWPWPLAALFVFKLVLDYLGIKWLGAPWFDDSPKQPDAPAPSLGSGGPPLPADAIHLPMPGWTVTESSDRCIVWRDADEAALTLTATSALEIPLADENALRAFCRRISEGAKGGLVEAGSISTPTGS